MAHKKFFVKSREWWKHLRHVKRPQEKRVRQDGKRRAKEERQ